MTTTTGKWPCYRTSRCIWVLQEKEEDGHVKEEEEDDYDKSWRRRSRRRKAKLGSGASLGDIFPPCFDDSTRPAHAHP